MTFRALVVDDEPVARAGLAAMVRTDPDFSQVGECGDRESAVDLIRTTRPHLVLLDVQLNPGTGFDVIELVGAAALPEVIFVTAFDQFALKAFEAAAVDYILKPVDPLRLQASLDRSKARLRATRLSDAAHRLTSLTASLRPNAVRPVAATDGERTLLFDPAEVVWIEAADYYARVHARGRSWLVRESLDAFEQRLPRPPFFRIHRSAIVNLRHVTEVARESKHRHVVVLRNGSRLRVSAERRKELDHWLGARAEDAEEGSSRT